MVVLFRFFVCLPSGDYPKNHRDIWQPHGFSPYHLEIFAYIFKPYPPVKFLIDMDNKKGSNQRILLDFSGWPSARGCFTRWLSHHGHQKKTYIWVYIYIYTHNIYIYIYTYTIQLVVTVPSYLLILRFNPHDFSESALPSHIIAFLHILSHFLVHHHWGSTGGPKLPQSGQTKGISSGYLIQHGWVVWGFPSGHDDTGQWVSREKHCITNSSSFQPLPPFNIHY